MIRFTPDTLLEWVLRPVAMAAPNGWVYTEIAAPDFRFVIVIALLAVALAMPLARRSLRLDAPLVAMLVLASVSFIVWVGTTGNGRYFLPYLIIVGPLCIAIAARLPVTKWMRGFVVCMTLAAQAFAVAQNSPWRPFDTWEWIAWRNPPYFDIDASPVAGDRDVTYVTLSTMTLSLVLPLLPASFRWVNVSAFNGTPIGPGEPDHLKRVERMLLGSNIRLMQRTQTAAMDPVTLQPLDFAADVFDASLAPYRLKLKRPLACKFLRSRSLMDLTISATSDRAVREANRARAGFWSCPLEHLAPLPAAPEALPSAAEQLAARAVSRIEQLCPRFFPPSGGRLPFNGSYYARSYQSTDFTLMVAGDQVWTQYMRALNPQKIGTVQQVLEPSFQLDCGKFRGRSGLPWEREI